MALPASRKVRALLAYLALAPRAGGAQPALRAAVGRAERSARRAALVPQQDQGASLDEPRPAARRDAAATRSRSTSRTASSMRSRSRRAAEQAASPRSPPERLRALRALFAGDFLEGLRSTAARSSTAGSPPSGAASAAATSPLLEHLVEQRCRRRRGAPRTWSSGSQLAPFDPRVPRDPARRARPARPHPRRRGASGGDRPAVRGRRARLRAPLRDAWRVGAGRRRRHRRGDRGRSAARAGGRATPSHPAPRRASIAVMPFVDRSARPRVRGGLGRRPRARRHHPARQAAQPVRHRAGHGVRAARARASAPEEAGPDAERRLRRQRLAAAPRRAPHRDGRAGRDAHARGSSGRRSSTTSWTTRSSCSTRSATGSSPRSRSEIETVERNRAILQAAELARRVGGAPSRPLAHVPVQPGRQRARPALLRDGGAARPDLRARLRRPVLHAFPERVPGLGGARAGDRPGLRGRRAEPHGRRSRPRRALGDGPRALAARPPGPVACVELERAIDLSPNFALGPLHAGLRPLARRATRRPPSRPPTIRASSARSTRCCSACSARAPWRWCASAGSRKPPTGPSRRRPARTRTRTSWRSPPSAWRWPVPRAGARLGRDAAPRASRVRHRRLPRRVPVRSERRGPVPQRGQAHRHGLTIAGDQEARASPPPRRKTPETCSFLTLPAPAAQDRARVEALHASWRRRGRNSSTSPSDRPRRRRAADSDRRDHAAGGEGRPRGRDRALHGPTASRAGRSRLRQGLGLGLTLASHLLQLLTLLDSFTFPLPEASA